MQTLFTPGRLLATPAALECLTAAGRTPFEFVRRHIAGDWSEMSAEDMAANSRAVADGSRVFSSYGLPDGARVWVITEADRGQTTVLLPSDY
ncbi:MAG: hypothetical protein ACK5TK_18565 [Betaproteobacteria bacterium]